METAHVSNRTCMTLCTPCYGLHIWIGPLLWQFEQKMAEMATAVYLSTNSSEITIVSNLNKAYSSEGVPTLNVANKVEFPKSLWCTLQSHKVQRRKNGWSRTVENCSFQWLCPCHHFGMQCLIYDSFDTYPLSSVSEQAVKRAKNRTTYVA